MDCLDRDNLLWISKAINAVSPMLHQLGARADQGQRPMPFVDRLYRVAFEMRQLQFDDVAIPRLGFLDLLIVTKCREGGAEAMGAMFGLGVDAERTQPRTKRS